MSANAQDGPGLKLLMQVCEQQLILTQQLDHLIKLLSWPPESTLKILESLVQPMSSEMAMVTTTLMTQSLQPTSQQQPAPQAATMITKLD